jgi:hypothetical protein
MGSKYSNAGHDATLALDADDAPTTTDKGEMSTEMRPPADTMASRLVTIFIRVSAVFLDTAE